MRSAFRRPTRALTRIRRQPDAPALRLDGLDRDTVEHIEQASRHVGSGRAVAILAAARLDELEAAPLVACRLWATLTQTGRGQVLTAWAVNFDPAALGKAFDLVSGRNGTPSRVR